MKHGDPIAAFGTHTHTKTAIQSLSFAHTHIPTQRSNRFSAYQDRCARCHQKTRKRASTLTPLFNFFKVFWKLNTYVLSLLHFWMVFWKTEHVCVIGVALFIVFFENLACMCYRCCNFKCVFFENWTCMCYRCSILKIVFWKSSAEFEPLTFPNFS